MAIEFNRAAYNKVFNDLDDFRDYCTTETDRYGNPLPFDEANLYNEKSWVWKNYTKFRNWQRAKSRANRGRK